MMRCKHCWTKADPQNGQCPVCGIVPDKPNGDLSAAEKKAQRYARAILLLAGLHALGALAVLVAFINMPGSILGRACALLAAISATLAVGFLRYALWAYRLAVVLYFLLGMVNVISINLGGILVSLIALYLVGNGTSKAIFERRLPE
ncbi:hypothetical protein [Pontiella sp.]|uniref:hypothetical protein n=1 Tax=Pontiella sp. TaxID=2837462 RepID=UPI0035683021